MKTRITIQWTQTARDSLAKVPKKTRLGIIRKIGDLRDSDPRKAGKPLVGPLEGLRSITHGRYRAIFGIEEKSLRGKDVLILVTVYVQLVGIRKERDKKDIYRVAKRLVDLGIIPAQPPKQDE